MEIELVHQNTLETHYDVLKTRGVFSDREIALHLARYAEAKILVEAERKIEEMERLLKRAKEG